MSKNNNNDFFWVGYSDLTTSLFFVMLILFVTTVAYLKNQQEQIKATLTEYESILQLKEQFKLLGEDESFYYLEECKKFVAKDLIGQEIFEPNKTNILNEFIEPTFNVGRKIEMFIDILATKSKNFDYLLVIEGNMANTYDRRFNADSEQGYKLSYERALAVYNLWLKKGIDLRKTNVEVLISGSGFNGLCREKVEENNKRFSIQIIPKVTNKI